MGRSFEQMSNKAKRITIAKDVLTWLKSGRMTARKLTYLADTEAENSEKLGPKCTACALGGLFACAAERKKLPLTNLQRIVDPESNRRLIGGGGYNLRTKLGDIFDADELRNIENAFEGNRRDPVNNAYMFEDSDNFSEDAFKFNAGIRSAKKRMQRIMRNIIRNEGKFVP